MSHRSLDIETLRERVSPAFEKIAVRINRIHSYIYNIREFSLGKFHLEFRSFPPYFPRFFPNTFLSFRTMDSTILSSLKFSSSSFFFFFAFSWATPVAYVGSQARGPIGAAATGLRQSHSNAGSEPHLQPTPQLTATPDR